MDLISTDHLLTTTRSVRKRLDFDRPVDLAVVQKCLEIAIQAPTGSNVQGWHFVVVTDSEKRARIGEFYRKSFRSYIQGQKSAARPTDSNDPRVQRSGRVFDSATYLALNMHKAPVLIVPCIEGRVERAGPGAQASLYGSILPATWSLMLALRSRGMGTSWTTLHLAYEREVAELLGIPDDVTQAALLPVAYYIGENFRPAKRIPARERTYYDSWGAITS